MSIDSRQLKYAAERGDAKAQFALGMAHLRGGELPVCFDEALRWFRAAGFQKHLEAQWRAGQLYESGLARYQGSDVAAQWYDRGAKGREEGGSAQERKTEKKTNASARKGWPAVESTGCNGLGWDRTSDRRAWGRGEEPLPLERAPTHWKAGCGRTALSGLEGGVALTAPSLPYLY